jgi:hypothetical protein
LDQEREAQTLVYRVPPLEEAEAQMLDSYSPGNQETAQLVYLHQDLEREEAQKPLHLEKAEVRMAYLPVKIRVVRRLLIKVRMGMLRQGPLLIRISQMVPDHLVE